MTFESGRRFTVGSVRRYRISQLARRSGVPATTLRFYESVGLLPAERTESGYRVYGEQDLDRLAFIGTAKQLGLPLEEIRELLSVWESGACADVRARLRPLITARTAEAARRIADLEEFAGVLRVARQHLDALPDRSSPCDPQCSFLSPAVPQPVAASQAAAPSHQRPSWRHAPVACSLTGQQQEERAEQWRRVLAGAEQEPIPEGVRLSLPADQAGAVAGLAAAEQDCCPFFDFRLHLQNGCAHLEVRAPAEAADLVTALFSPTS